MKFNDPLAAIDLLYFINNKQDIAGCTDLIIEIIPLQDNRKLEISLVTFCKINEERNENRINYKVKVDSQKLNVFFVK